MTKFRRYFGLARVASFSIASLATSLAASVIAPTHAQAAPSATNRVALVDRAEADFAMRIRMIQEARKSIDVIMSHHTSDQEIGLPMLLAMREAAKRGVKVRLITGFFPSDHSKSTAALRIILNDDGLKTRPEMIMIGRWFHKSLASPDAQWWTTFDEKVLIVDGEKAVIGGRNVGQEYLHWLDNTLYLEGPAVTEMQEKFFNPAWALAVKLWGYTRGDVSRPWPWQHESYGPFKMTASLKAGVLEGNQLMDAPKYSPTSVSLLHNGLIARMVQYAPYRMPVPTPDPILDTFLAMAQKAKRVYYYSLYPAADRRMAPALGKAIKNGANVVMITNSLLSAKNLDSTGVPYYGSIVSMHALAYQGVKVQMWMPTDKYRFMHQKMAVIDDTVIFGSHNFNYSSTHTYDQLDLVIQDKALADELARQFESQVKHHTRRASSQWLLRQRKRAWFGVWASKALLGLY